MATPSITLNSVTETTFNGTKVLSLSWSTSNVHGMFYPTIYYSTSSLSSYTGTTIISSNESVISTTNNSAHFEPISTFTGGVTYYFRIYNRSNTWVNVLSNQRSITISPREPGVPTNIVASSGDGTAEVSFTSPNTNGSSITAYNVSVLTGGTTIKTVIGYSSPIIVSDLTNGTPYTFTVSATNSIGTGSASEPSNEVTPMSSGAVCFLGNAPVLTPAGYRRIDSLAVGDMVRTADGRDVAIQRIKHQRVIAPSAAVNPYVIPKGTWGATENLAISPRHCVAIPGRGMVEARELGLRQLSMKAAFDYYNLELPEWDNMIVAGVEVESLAPKKRVVMTAAQFRELVGAKGSVDIAKLARIATVRADGSVDVMLTRKERRLTA
jgi:hypothetical protein